MNETHWCEDKDTLVEYLYDDLDVDRRRVFEGHLRTCVSCAQEIETLQGVRTELAEWMPPEAELGFTVALRDALPRTAVPMNGNHKPATVLQSPRWSVAAMPMWARAAAAVFLVGAGLGLANVQIRYGADGVSVSTGWMRSAEPSVARDATSSTIAEASRAVPAAQETAAWRPELAALEADLRKELQAMRADSNGAEPVATRVSSADDQAMLRRVQSLIADSERRQEQELARRLNQFGRESEMQRRADLVRLEQGFVGAEAQRGAQVVRQQQMLDYLYRVSTSKVP